MKCVECDSLVEMGTQWADLSRYRNAEGSNGPLCPSCGESVGRITLSPPIHCIDGKVETTFRSVFGKYLDDCSALA